MSNRRRKSATRAGKGGTARRPLSSEQNARLQQAVLAHSAGQLAVAESAYRTLIAEHIGNAEVYCRLAHICAQSGRRGEADVLWRKALAIDPASIDAQMSLAGSLQMAGKLERAKKAYRQVIKQHKDFHIAKYLLANILKSQGDIDKAKALYQEIMVQKPDYTQAHFTYAGVHRYTQRSDPHIDTMLGLYRRENLEPEGRIHLAFALGKAFEDIADYAQAFEYLQDGNERRHREFRYDIESDRLLFDGIIDTFSGAAIEQFRGSGTESNRPIFIVGMPRSGTSLVEKIVASHSAVFGAGELEYMFALGSQNVLSKMNGPRRVALGDFPLGMFAEIGEAYLDRVAALDSNARHVTDKMPFNMMMIGLIKLVLPNAKIIHCVRDARDTCFSIFKQNFTSGSYRFAYDLKSIAQFHNQYMRLMRHWHAALPGEIYDVSYEQLVSDPTSAIRELLAACDLDFQDSCLQFQKTKAVVTTASASQVRRPMYTSSVGMWKNYKQFLEPMLDELNAA
tara:strand:+ start:1495 stop:3021 length:1527 start_codon:yes stop_codon:yes gene_type:complete